MAIVLGALVFFQHAHAAPLFLYQDMSPHAMNDKAKNRFLHLKKISEDQSDLAPIELRPFSIDSLKFESAKQVTSQFPSFEMKVNGGGLLRAIHLRTLEQPNHFFSWVGRIEGDLHSSAVFTLKDGQMAGDILAFGESYSIKPIDQGTVAVRKLNPHQFQYRFEDVIVQDPAKKKSNSVKAQALSVENDGSVIDIYVFYSSAAGLASSAIATEIANDIAFTNSALDNSCTQTSLRLVGTGELVFNETTDGDTMLNEMSGIDDGSLDTVYDTLRTAGADMAQLWVENLLGSDSNKASVGTIAGIGISALPHPGFSSAFSIKVRSTAASVTAHEIGHNFTIYHDRFQCPGIQLQSNYPDETGFGFVNVNEKVRDIMSYSTECAFHSTSCSVLPYYSNPRFFVNGHPFGIANQADAAYQIFKNRIYMAQIRPAASTPVAPSFAGCAETQRNSLKLDKCFIATAAFGSFLDPEVSRFRQVRDEFLEKHSLGRKFIEVYYQLSPAAADWIQNHPWSKPLVRVLLYGLLLILSCLKSPVVIFLALLCLGAFFPFLLRNKKKVPWFFVAFFFVASNEAHGAFNNPSLFAGEVNENPASLITPKESKIVSLGMGHRSNVYGSQSAQSLNLRESAALAVEFRLIGPKLAGLIFVEPGTKEQYTWPKSSESDSWNVDRTQYQAEGAFAILDSVFLGLGYRRLTTQMDRASVNNGDWGVRATERIAQTDLVVTGVRWIVTDGFAVGSMAEYGQSISSDTAKTTVARGAVSAGYFGSPESIVRKVDAAYVVVPQAVGFEGRPYGNGLQTSASGYQIDGELRFKIDSLSTNIMLGAQYGSTMSSGFNGSGSKVSSTVQKLKVGANILTEYAQINLIAANTVTDYGLMKETDTLTTLALSVIF